MAQSIKSLFSTGTSRGLGALVKGPRITRTLKDIKLKTKQLEDKVERAKKRGLIRQAAYCKGVARRMIRPAKKGESSKPGKPPRMHNGSKAFKLSINWGYSNSGGYSVAGPAQITNRNVPGALHKGGRSVAVRSFPKKKNRAESDLRKKKRKQRRRNSKGQFVADRRFKQGPAPAMGGRVVQKVKKRPFMDKALKITLKNFPGMFRGSVVR